MAEVGIIASIIGVAGAAATIAKGLYQIASEVGSAGREVRLIAQDTNAFSQVLTNLSQMLNGGTASTERARIIVKDLIILCREILDDSKMLLQVLQPLVKLTGKKWKRGALRFRWLFEKSKFAIHRQSLEALKSTLTLLVATMTYVDAAKADVPQTISSSLRTQLESVREEVKLSAHDYEPLLLQIQDNVLAIRSEAIKAYTMIQNPQVKEEDVVISEQQNNTIQNQNESQRTKGPRANSLEDTGKTNDKSLNISRSGRICPQPTEDDSDNLAVPVTALAVHTGLPGLPYLQRQALHLADDVLDSNHEALTKTTTTTTTSSQALQRVDPLWQRNTTFEESSELADDIQDILDNIPLSTDQTLVVSARQDDELVTSTDLVRQSEADSVSREKRKWEHAKKKYSQVKKEAFGKIAYNNFKVGDLALFLPTVNTTLKPWAAFNIDRPHVFLKELPEFKLKSRSWIVGRIVSIEARIVNINEPGGKENNPFDLSDGLKWWLVTAEDITGTESKKKENSSLDDKSVGMARSNDGDKGGRSRDEVKKETTLDKLIAATAASLPIPGFNSKIV